MKTIQGLACSLLLIGTACIVNTPVNKNTVTVVIGNVDPKKFLTSDAAEAIDRQRYLVHTDDLGKLQETFGNLLTEVNETLQTGLVDLGNGKLSPDTILQALAAKDFIRQVEPDVNAEVKPAGFHKTDFQLSGQSRFSLQDYRPQDPYYNQTINTSEGSSNVAYGLQLIQAPKAWEITQGNDTVIVAVLDTGIDLKHPEFQGRLVEGYDFVNNDADPSDDHGHGTHVSGIIAAGMDNGHGLTGVAPKVRIMPVKVLNQNNGGKLSNVANGIVWAVDHGARIINLSMEAPSGQEKLRAAIDYAVKKHVFIVAAMGNDGQNQVRWPAAFAENEPGVGAVGAVTPNQTVASFSNSGVWMTLSAPGKSIFSTFPRGTGKSQQALQSTDYEVLDGTSQAAPYVSGVAALLLSKYPQLTPGQIRQILTQSTIHLGTKQGFDPSYGHGLVNAYQALKLAESSSLQPVQPEKPAFSIRRISAYPFYITATSQVQLTVQVENPGRAQLGYGWAVSAGQIVGEGPKVVWQVPDRAGQYQIVVGVGDEKHSEYAMTNAVVYEK